MADATDIEAYHALLVRALNDERLLGQTATIRANPNQDWKNKKFTGAVDFDLWPTESAMKAVSDRGGHLAVFAFDKIAQIGSGNLIEINDRSSDTSWISWHERWERLVPEAVIPGRKSKQPHFMLTTSQWILFWGHPEGEKKQIMRAEWDNAAHVSRKKTEYDLAKSKSTSPGADDENSSAGQPHWHVDRVLELGDFESYLQYRGTDLQEIAHSDYVGRYLNLKRVHLAMGGWKNQQAINVPVPASDAARWQIEYTEGRDELIDWSVSTLRYIKSQIQYISRL